MFQNPIQKENHPPNMRTIKPKPISVVVIAKSAFIKVVASPLDCDLWESERKERIVISHQNFSYTLLTYFKLSKQVIRNFIFPILLCIIFHNPKWLWRYSSNGCNNNVREELGTEENHGRDNQTLIYHHTIARTSTYRAVNPHSCTETLVASRKNGNRPTQRLEMEVHYELLNFIVQTGRGKNSRTMKMKVQKKVEIHTQTEKWLKRQGRRLQIGAAVSGFKYCWWNFYFM